jgi:hypothetical protein
MLIVPLSVEETSEVTMYLKHGGSKPLYDRVHSVDGWYKYYDTEPTHAKMHTTLQNETILVITFVNGKQLVMKAQDIKLYDCVEDIIDV